MTMRIASILCSLVVMAVTATASIANAAAYCPDPADPVQSLIKNMGKPIYDTDEDELRRFETGGPTLRTGCDSFQADTENQNSRSSF